MVTKVELDFQIRLIEIKNSNIKKEVSKLRSRTPIPPQVDRIVKKILKDVEVSGDRAVFDYTQELDGVKLDSSNVRISKEEVEEAYLKVSKDQIKALKFAKSRLEKLEKIIMRKELSIIDENDLSINQKFIPIRSVGCYIPGGKAIYPSSLLMTVIPAKVAGVNRIVVTSPPRIDGSIAPLTLAAADICGVEEFYKIGGAQAIASLAYGTETVKPVEKIVGPGNIYVTAAKLNVSNIVDIDLPAGPSELLIIADETANPSFIARDMISQAEHGNDSVCGLITDSPNLAKKVIRLIRTNLDKIQRREIIEISLMEKGFIATCNKINTAVEFSNLYAPEHLEIMTRNPGRTAIGITSAGLVLIGKYTPSAASDYCIGTNHVLPTGGYARTRSGLSSLDYMKRIEFVDCSKKALSKIRKSATVLASSEGLFNHSLAIEERFKTDA